MGCLVRLFKVPASVQCCFISICLTVPLPFVLALLFFGMKITCLEEINNVLLLRAHDGPSY